MPCGSSRPFVPGSAIKVGSHARSGSSTPINTVPPVLGAAVHLMPGKTESHPYAQRYFLVPGDSTFRTNEDGPGIQCLLSPKVLSPSEVSVFSEKTSQGPPAESTDLDEEYRGAKRFFSLTSIRSTVGVAASRTLTESNLTPTASDAPRWVPFEPCRISVEWFITTGLRDKQRLYSRTWAYGGSYWNCYLQVQLAPPPTSGASGKKRAQQIGCYLHRQSVLEPIPVAAQPPSRPETLDTGTRALIDPWAEGSPYALSSALPPFSPAAALLRRTTSPADLGGGGRAASGSFSSLSRDPGQPAQAEVAPVESSLMGPPLTYVDQRKVVSCHFSIHLFSRAGTALANFTSEPSEFAVAQSWGYKSGKLFSEEYLGREAMDILLGSTDTEGGVGSCAGLESLKATVTMSLV